MFRSYQTILRELFCAWLLSYLEQLNFVLRWLCSSMHLDQVMCPFRC